MSGGRTRRHASDRSYLSVDWRQPVNWEHRLNEGLVDWLLAVPHCAWGTTFKSIVRPDRAWTSTNMEATDWDIPIGASRPGGWACSDIGGTNEYHTIASLVTAVPFTFTCWGRPANATAKMTAVSIGNAANFSFACLYFDGSTGGDPIIARSDSDASGSATASSASGFTANEWHHAAGVFAAANSRTAYLNGVPGTTETTTITQAAMATGTSGSLFANGGPYDYFTGQIDSVRIYNRALSDADVPEEYELTRNYNFGLLNRRRRVTYFVPAAPPAGGTKRYTLTTLGVG